MRVVEYDTYIDTKERQYVQKYCYNLNHSTLYI